MTGMQSPSASGGGIRAPGTTHIGFSHGSRKASPWEERQRIFDTQLHARANTT